jgi:hypothetical protein
LPTVITNGSDGLDESEDNMSHSAMLRKSDSEPKVGR